jgi:glycosyltransferase involved in cell wall biosynthesis
MNIQVILDDLYPNGMALATRIHLYARGFIQSGHKVFILIPRPYEKYGKVPKNADPHGFVDNVEFKYSALTTVRSKYFIIKQVVDIFSLLNAAVITFQKRKQTDVLLVVSNNAIQILLFKLMALVTNKVIILEKSEFPFIFEKKNQLTSIYQKLYIRYIYKMFDGIIVISKSLEAYFMTKKKHGAKLLLVPIIVDPQVFIDTQNSPKLTDEVVYAGILNQSKDGILDIIDAFCRLNQIYKDKKLVLMGDIEASECKEGIYDLISKNNVRDNVIITGYVARSVVVDRLKKAEVLILAKPASLQSEHSFPTKVGEYLATGKPVVLTNVGCINQYLTDEINAFIAEPNNIESLSGKLLEVYINYKRSLEIGQRGQQVAINQFDYRNQSKVIIDFFRERINKKRGDA